VQIFFPDPWQKRKHNKRRLVQDEFIALITTKLKPQGIFHLATDWEDYAQQMMQVLSRSEKLLNCAGENNFAARSDQRPVITKFEQRGEKSGRPIWELQFACV
jgi:tRNA (guanine-N7-)-methyltransferase